ncbi:MAG TPA: ThuA domain-containing protein [Polyangiaceae bacterium]|nr:ThuA domain-containing protein [Polyangiaceae bacterium]
MQLRCSSSLPRIGLFAAVSLGLACSPGSGDEAPRAGEPGIEDAVRALVFTRTAGYRHASIEDARALLTELEASAKIASTFTEDPALFSDEGLSSFDVVVFANTTGDVLDEEGEAALERFVRRGGGFVGVHAAADTEHESAFYGELLGARFVSHPEIPLEVEVTVERADHPSTAHFAPRFSFTDEWYNFDRNPRETATVLLTIDESGFTVPNVPPGPSMGPDHPVAWYKEFGSGRMFYTNLGHRPETYQDPGFRAHLTEGIRWAARGGGFSRAVLTRTTKNPMALAVAPHGDVYFIERTGEVRRYDPRTGRVTDAAVLAVDTAHENGLLGIALDPEFAENRFVYLYYSEPLTEPLPLDAPPGRNVLARFTARADGTLDASTRVELLAVPSERRCCHEGGALAFLTDGTLLITTGDNTNPFQSQGAAPVDGRPGREGFDARRTSANPFDLRGKILRIRKDGTIPPGNLFPESGELGRPEVYALGVRNPFRIAPDPASGRVFFGDVGPDAAVDAPRGPRGYDEINLLEAPGDYGWPECIAHNLPYSAVDFETGVVGDPFDCTGRVPALLAYDYGASEHPALGSGTDATGVFRGRTAIAGAVYRAPSGARFALPARFDGALLMADWTRDVLAAVSVDASGALGRIERLLAAESFRRPIDLEIGPDGAIYVLEYGSEFWGDNADAALSRIEYGSPEILSPIAAIRASVTHGAPPLTVELSGLDSRVAGPGQTLVEYAWDLDGDGHADAQGPVLEHTFESAGEHSVALTVTSSSGAKSLPVAVSIVVGNAPPVARILSPGRGSSVAPGGTVVLQGEAIDPEDGVAACEELVWNVSLGHNAHAHPFETLSGCTASFVADSGEHGASTDVTFYAVELVYTDHGGANGEPPLTARHGIRVDIVH